MLAAHPDVQEISYMSIRTICPECQTIYQLADQQVGKKVRCKNCQSVFVAAEVASQQTAIRGDSAPPSSVRTKPAVAPLRRRGDDDDARAEPQRSPARNVEKKNILPWVLGGVAAVFGLLLLACGALITYLLMAQDKTVQVANTPAPPPAAAPAPPPQPLPTPPPPAANPPPPPPQTDKPPISVQPIEQSVKLPQAVVETPKPSTETRKESPPANTENPPRESANRGRLNAERREFVKRATVYLRVHLPDGSTAFGTGFFGCKESPSIVLTNAHVVGMLAPDSARPQSVEVIVNSGEASEWKTTARILGVDRVSDLAVLDIGTPPQPLPEPLSVKEAASLQALDEVYVFGFPLGEHLGKEITIRPASVSALRKKNGVVERVQVNGGMDEGNSGGPVVDSSGAVVGVAVAGYRGRQINFAIPGERVQAILSGRIADLSIQQPYYTADNKIAAPVVMDTIDPRNLIKEVGLEIWTGDKPADAKSASRPATTQTPTVQAGDSQHLYYKLKYLAPQGKGEVLLPELPPGKVYWQQARWLNNKGEMRWEPAKPITNLPQPVYRKPANLVLRFSQGNKRALDLTLENIFKVGNDEADDAFRVRTTAQLTETVVSTGSNGTQLNLRYRYPPSRELILPDGKSIPHPALERFKEELPRLITTIVQLDRLGNITRQVVDPRPLAQLSQIDPRQVKSIKEFHEMVQQGLEALAVSLPASGSAKPLDSWKAERYLPIDTPGRAESGKLDMSFTYLGTRKRDGREEAVLGMEGLVHGKNDAVSGRANGQILVDLSNGQPLLAETTVKLQLKALLSKPGEPEQELRVIAIMNFRMQRKRTF